MKGTIMAQWINLLQTTGLCMDGKHLCCAKTGLIDLMLVGLPESRQAVYIFEIT